jgi:hypothetical protein
MISQYKNEIRIVQYPPWHKVKKATTNISFPITAYRANSIVADWSLVRNTV